MWDNPASIAIDGNTVGDFPAVTHTDAEINPWWRANFNLVANVTSVTVYNRRNCCGSRLTGAILELLGPNEQVLATRVITIGVNDAAPFSQQFEVGTVYDVASVRIRIDKDTPEVLSLAEVEVFGTVMMNLPEVSSLLLETVQ